jgi:hypothetical protein
MNIIDKLNKYLGEAADNEYEVFFRKMLKKYGVKSPEDLDDDTKKKFYAEVDDKWKSKEEKN